MTAGRVIPRTELLTMVRAAGAPADQLIALEPLPGAPDALQVAIRCNNAFRAFKCGLRAGAADNFRGTDKEMSRNAAAMWDLLLQQMIEIGQPEMVMPGVDLSALM